MKSLYESILDNDKEIQKSVSANVALEQIKKVILETAGSLTDTKAYNKSHYEELQHGEMIYYILCMYNLDKDNFTHKFRAFINRLKKIRDIVIDWNIIDAGKIFNTNSPGFSKSKDKLYAVKIYLEKELLLEFYVDDIFVNYKIPAAGMGLAFNFKSKYKFFLDMFEGKYI